MTFTITRVHIHCAWAFGVSTHLGIWTEAGQPGNGNRPENIEQKRAEALAR